RPADCALGLATRPEMSSKLDGCSSRNRTFPQCHGLSGPELQTSLVDFLTIHNHFFWRKNSQAHSLALNSNDRDRDVSIDNNRFTGTACQNQHRVPSLSRPGLDRSKHF